MKGFSFETIVVYVTAAVTLAQVVYAAIKKFLETVRQGSN